MDVLDRQIVENHLLDHNNNKMSLYPFHTGLANQWVCTELSARIATPLRGQHTSHAPAIKMMKFLE